MAQPVLVSWIQSWSLVAISVLVGITFRKAINAIIEKIESRLDEILGLATSEPTRKAILTIEQTSFLHGVMEPIALRDDSPAIQKSIRSLRIREETRISIVAIYREGKHISNPSPETPLMANDILIVIGNEEERRNAKALLLAKRFTP